VKALFRETVCKSLSTNSFLKLSEESVKPTHSRVLPVFLGAQHFSFSITRKSLLLCTARIGQPIVENGVIKGVTRGIREEITIIKWRNRTCTAPEPLKVATH
jgi:hypothetical protein